jgi:VWFA-related protein
VNVSRRSLLSAAASLSGARFLRGQQSVPNQSDATFSTNVNVVTVFATVRDIQGQVVRNLTKDDFLLDEDGQPQKIGYFSQESNLPLTLGLLVDTSGSTRRVLPDERDASYRFLEQVLREDKDQAFLIHFDFEVELLQDLSSSRAQLEKALNQLGTSDRPQMSRRSGGQSYPGGGGGGGGSYPGGGGGGRRHGGGTSLYDAVFLASDELMKKQKGRKSLILMSDGVDNGSKLTLSECVESAQRADTLVYSILFEDPAAINFGGFGGPRMGGRHGGYGGNRPAMNRPDGKKVLERISQETGGRFFEVSKKQPIDKVFAAIEEDLRNQYSIGYTPTAAVAGYRHIHVAAKPKGLTVQAREGYYAL